MEWYFRFRCLAVAHMRYEKELKSKQGNWFTQLFISKSQKEQIQRVQNPSIHFHFLMNPFLIRISVECG
jgi:hypothetical protein